MDALCYAPCLSLYTTASSACPNIFDLSCVCKNMDIFNEFSCCVGKCGTGFITNVAWDFVQGTCATFGGAPAKQLSCKQGGSGGSPASPVVTNKASHTTPKAIYSNQPYFPLGGHVPAPAPPAPQVSHISPTTTVHPYYAGAGLTSGSSSTTKGTKRFGMTGLLSLGLGALLVAGL